jgi:hypothetical protein
VRIFLFGPPVSILLGWHLLSLSVLTSPLDWSEQTTTNIGGPPMAGKPGKPHGCWEWGALSLRAVSPRQCRGLTGLAPHLPYQLRGESLCSLGQFNFVEFAMFTFSVQDSLCTVCTVILLCFVLLYFLLECSRTFQSLLLCFLVIYS